MEHSVWIVLPELLAVPVLCVASWRDIRSGKVENLFTYLILILGFAGCVILALRDEGILRLLFRLAGVLPPLILAVPWLKGKLGGADLKLSLSLGLMWGLELITVLLAVCFVSAGIFVLVRLCVNRLLDRESGEIPLVPFLFLGHMWVLLGWIL